MVLDPRSHERVPPHDADAESALLGAMLLDRDVITELVHLLRPDDFYVTTHRLVFEAIRGLEELAGSSIDVVTLKDELKRRKSLETVGGPDALIRLLESVPSAAGARHHAKIVRDCAQLRALIQAAQETLRDSFDASDAVETVVDRVEQRFFEVRHADDNEARCVKDLIQDTFARLEKFQGREHGKPTGLDTGFADLNDLLDGLHSGQLIVIAARPSMGKTSFALNIASHAAIRDKVPTLVFSLEVPKEQVVENVLCSWAKVDAHRMRRGELEPDDWSRLTGAANDLSTAPLYVDDTPSLSILAIRAKARRMQRKANIGLIVVDYLQLMTAPDSESRILEITRISQGLKALARELRVPVISLSQLNRAVDAREDHEPRMSDLRESGSIEQDADVVVFLYREAYYKDVVGEKEREADIIVAKHRNGRTGKVRMWFFREFMRFGDRARSPM